jgi:hypothetical protein
VRGHDDKQEPSALCIARPPRYRAAMEYVLPVLVVIAMLGALGALVFGVVNMAKGGNPRRSNKIMQSRVLLQGLALLLFAIFMLLFRRH